MLEKQLFTVGHSTDSADKFLANLAAFEIDTVVDVRSVPYSKFVDHFNREPLSAFLKKNRIHYIHMGDCFGARYNDPDLLFEDGMVDFSKVAATSRFLEGILRIENGLKKGHRVAIMCSEKNPLECHRFSLVSPAFHLRGHEINHIVDGNTFSHKILESRLVEYCREHGQIVTDLSRITRFHLVQPSLFDRLAITADVLYRMLNRQVGFNAIKVAKKAV